MNKKKLLGISILGIFILVAIIGYVSKQKYDSLLKATTDGLTLGKAYGKLINQSDCMIGLQMKYAPCTTTECELSAIGYISGCIDAAEKDDFCSTVPNIKDTDKAIGWVSKTCAQNNLGNDKCLKYLHKFVSACTEQNEARTLSKVELIENGIKKGLKESSN